MTDERVDPENVVLTFPTFGVQAETTVVAALLEDLLSALQIPVLKSSDDHPAYERLLGTFVLDAVSTFYLNLKPRPYAALPLRHLTIALNDLGRGISNPIFDKPPNTSTPPDPTMFWLLRAESAALLKTLIDKKYEGQSKAADRIFRKIGHLLPRLTKRPFPFKPELRSVVQDRLATLRNEGFVVHDYWTDQKAKLAALAKTEAPVAEDAPSLTAFPQSEIKPEASILEMLEDAQTETTEEVETDA